MRLSRRRWRRRSSCEYCCEGPLKPTSTADLSGLCCQTTCRAGHPRSEVECYACGQSLQRRPGEAGPKEVSLVHLDAVSDGAKVVVCVAMVRLARIHEVGRHLRAEAMTETDVIEV